MLNEIGFDAETIIDLDYGGNCCWGDIHATAAGEGYFISVSRNLPGNV